MQNHDRQNQAAGPGPAGIHHILLRHKWKIICFSSAGFLVAALVYFRQPTVYSSEAKLFIRYVLDARLSSGIGGDPQYNTLASEGVNIINSEIEILKSLDLATQVVDAIGAEKIIGQGGGETNKNRAATILIRGLAVQVPPHSDILRIVFQHPNDKI